MAFVSCEIHSALQQSAFNLVYDQVIDPGNIAVYLSFGREKAALGVDIGVGEYRIYFLRGCFEMMELNS